MEPSDEAAVGPAQENGRLATDEALARSWDANAAAWAAVVGARRIESRRVATDRAVLQAILARAPRRVLDAGCGEGWLTRALSARGVEAIGIDACAALIDIARRGGDGEFHVLPFDALATPERVTFHGRAFDAVAFNFSLLQEDLGPVLAATQGRLAPTGVLVIQTVHPWTARGALPYANGWRMETFGGFDVPFPAAMPWYYRTMGGWVSLLAASGFVIDTILEPAHPDTGEPLSLLIIAVPSLRR